MSTRPPGAAAPARRAVKAAQGGRGALVAAERPPDRREAGRIPCVAGVACRIRPLPAPGPGPARALAGLAGP
jgi:hypothetical protein